MAKKAKRPQKVAKKKPAPKKAARRRSRLRSHSEKSRLKKKRGEVPFRQGSRIRSQFAVGTAGQSGDLQGLSNRESADSESVDELVEEGNAFEAEVVAGVEDAGDDEREVHTREVPEDDVPGEYLDKD